MLRVLELHDIKNRMRDVEAYLEEALNFPHPALRESALSMLHAGGKRVRPALALLTASMYGNEAGIVPLAAALEMIHMASLIHDDVVDGASTRRGEPTVNILHGNRYAIHVGDYVLVKAVEIVRAQPESDRLLRILADLCVEMSLGEVEQLRGAFDTAQTEETYYYRIDRKTALLMASSCQAAAVASGGSEEEIELFYKIGYHLGMAFQIQDDILDLHSNANTLGKPVGRDLANGILTLPVILVLQKDFAEREELLCLIEGHFAGGQAEVDRAVAIIEAQGGVTAAQERAESYLRQGEAYIAALPDFPQKEILRKGVEYLRARVS